MRYSIRTTFNAISSSISTDEKIFELATTYSWINFQLGSTYRLVVVVVIMFILIIIITINRFYYNTF